MIITYIHKHTYIRTNLILSDKGNHKKYSNLYSYISYEIKNYTTLQYCNKKRTDGCNLPVNISSRKITVGSLRVLNIKLIWEGSATDMVPVEFWILEGWNALWSGKHLWMSFLESFKGQNINNYDHAEAVVIWNSSTNPKTTLF